MLTQAQHLIVFPISRGAQVTVVAFTSEPSKEGTQYSANEKEWVASVPKEELLQAYAGWEPEVTALLEVRLYLVSAHVLKLTCRAQCVDKPSKWAIHAVRPLSTFVSGRVALLGDSVSCPECMQTIVQI